MSARPNPKQARARKLKEENLKAAYRSMLGSEQGRTVLWHILESCGIYSSTMPTDSLTMAFRNGQRNVGLVIVSSLENATPAGYAKLLQLVREQETEDASVERADGSDEEE